ncbi:CHASE3 domain-containing protein [Streptosporangium lutulentum]
MTTETPPSGTRQSRWSAQTWFNVVLLSMAVLLAVSAVVGAAALGNAASASNRLIDGISMGRIQAERLQTTLVNQETGMRGFVLTGKEEFLQPYVDGRRDELNTAQQIRTLKPAAELLRRLDDVERLSDEWRFQQAEPMIADVRGTGPETVGTERTEEGKRVFDMVRKALDAQNAAWTQAREDARAELATARWARDLTFFAILLAFLITIVTMAVLLRIAVFRP